MTNGVKDPNRYAGQRTWSGNYVVCTACVQGCVPTWTANGWQLPEHFVTHTKDRARCRCIEGRHRCPASGAPVSEPEHQTIRRQCQAVPDAHGLEAGEDLMGGPRT